MFSFLFIVSNAFAGPVYIAVGEAKIKKSVLAFTDTKVDSSKKDAKTSAKTIKELLLHDLDYTNLFEFQNPDAFLDKGEGLSLDQFKMADWSTIGTEFLIKTAIVQKGSKIEYELRLYDVLGSKQILGKKYDATVSDIKTLSHTAANDVFEALTGKRGIFLNKIAMVCDKTGHKEIWMTDYDGANPKQVTNHRTLAFAPAWSPDNRYLAYSLYTKNRKNIKNIDLFEYDFQTRKSKLLSNRRGINSGADYSPDGKKIALTMSFLGNPEIFLLDRKSLQVSRLTKSIGFDVDPHFSPNGEQFAFVSSRSGKPMVFVAKKDGTGVNRITFAGEYNATPRWKPDGSRLVFAGHLEKHFDLFLISPNGLNLERLTKDEGSNEDPHFSPDGNFIIFTSNRTGQKNVYVITLDGTKTTRLTYGLGNCEAARFSNYDN